MKRILTLLICVQLLCLFGAGEARAEDQEGRARWMFGPRVGVSCVAAKRDDFNSSVQDLFPGDRKYFPLFSQIGISSEQLIRLGKTRNHFAFQELILVGGLEQNIALPDVSVLLGFKTHFGLELGLGPDVGIRSSGGELRFSLALALAVGWTLRFKGISVPITFIAVPTPADVMPRFSLLTGFNFEVLE